MCINIINICMPFLSLCVPLKPGTHQNKCMASSIWRVVMRDNGNCDKICRNKSNAKQHPWQNSRRDSHAFTYYNVTFDFRLLSLSTMRVQWLLIFFSSVVFHLIHFFSSRASYFGSIPLKEFLAVSILHAARNPQIRKQFIHPSTRSIFCCCSYIDFGRTFFPLFNIISVSEMA